MAQGEGIPLLVAKSNSGWEVRPMTVELSTHSGLGPAQFTDPWDY